MCLYIYVLLTHALYFRNKILFKLNIVLLKREFTPFISFFMITMIAFTSEQQNILLCIDIVMAEIV